MAANGGGVECRYSVWRTYGDFKVHELLCKCAHLVVEAEAVLADLVGCEHKVALALLRAIEDDLLWAAIGARADNRVIDVERAARLHGEVERDLSPLVFHVCEEAGLLVRIEAVGERRGVYGGAVCQQEADDCGEGPHRGRGCGTAS